MHEHIISPSNYTLWLSIYSWFYCCVHHLALPQKVDIRILICYQSAELWSSFDCISNLNHDISFNSENIHHSKHRTWCSDTCSGRCQKTSVQQIYSADRCFFRELDKWKSIILTSTLSLWPCSNTEGRNTNEFKIKTDGVIQMAKITFHWWRWQIWDPILTHQTKM